MNINDYRKRFEPDYKNEELKIAQEKAEKRREENARKDQNKDSIDFGLKDNDGW